MTCCSAIPPTPRGRPTARRGGIAPAQHPEGLCQALLAVLEVSRGQGPRRRYDEDHGRWHAAASRLLADHPPDKLLDAIAYLEFDQIVGTKVRGMPHLEKHIEDLRHRSHAHRRQVATTNDTAASQTPTWAHAFGDITATIRRYGAGGSAAARSELAAVHPAYAAFIDSVGWTSLCRDDPQRRQWDWQQAWKQACQTAITIEEAA